MPLFITNAEEEKEISELNNKYSHLLEKSYNEYLEAKGKENEKEKLAEYYRIATEYDKKNDELYKKIEAHELRYFSKHIDELCENIRNYATSNVKTIRHAQKINDEWAKDLFKNEDDFRYSLRRELTPHLSLLAQKAPERHDEIIAFIDYAFENADKISKEANEKPQKEKAVKIVPKRVDKTLQPIDKLSGSLFDPNKNKIFYSCDTVDLVVGYKKDKEVTTAVSININELKNISFSNGVMLDPYCKAVHDALVSLYFAGNNGATYTAIYRVMNGNKPTLKQPKEKALNEIKDCIEKMRHTDVTIQITGESELYKFSKLKIKDYVMPVRIATLTVNGQTAEGVIFRGEPPLYEYARQKNQVNTADIKFLDVPLSATRENTIIVNYLLERLQSALNKRSHLSDTILYETLYELLQLDAPTKETLRAKKRDVRKKVKEILDSWKEDGKIRGYEEETEKTSNKVRAIKILLS